MPVLALNFPTLSTARWQRGLDDAGGYQWLQWAPFVLLRSLVKISAQTRDCLFTGCAGGRFCGLVVRLDQTVPLPLEGSCTTLCKPRWGACCSLCCGCQQPARLGEKLIINLFLHSMKIAKNICFHSSAIKLLPSSTIVILCRLPLMRN